MYCKYCGKEIDDNAAYCQYCGKPVNDINDYNTNSYAPYGEPAPAAKEYNIMAILGIIFSVIGFSSLVMAVSGLVFSIIGYKQAVKSGKSKGLAIAGIVVGIIAVILQTAVTIIDIISGYGYIEGADYY